MKNVFVVGLRPFERARGNVTRDTNLTFVAFRLDAGEILWLARDLIKKLRFFLVKSETKQKKKGKKKKKKKKIW